MSAGSWPTLLNNLWVLADLTEAQKTKKQKTTTTTFQLSSRCRSTLQVSIVSRVLHSCQLSRFCRDYPGLFSLSRIPPGLLTCNRISRNSYISPHNFFQELLHKLATHLTTTTTESCTVMHSQQVWIELTDYRSNTRNRVPVIRST